MKDILRYFEVPFQFRSRPESLPGDLRPVWRMCLLILMLAKVCRGDRASFRKLYILNWAIRSAENKEILLEVLERSSRPQSLIIRVEPSLNRAVDFGIGEGCLEIQSGKRVSLTEKGRSIARLLEDDPIIFEYEKKFLDHVGNRLSETMVHEILS